MVKPECDFSVQNCGSVCLFTLQTEAVLEWVRDNVSLEGWQWMGKRSFAVDHHYADSLAEAMIGDGWICS